jgi:dihydropteroate synthase
MGVLNCTPDSFYDGGRHSGPGEAITRGMALAEEGADLIDVGGESTRPGAYPVDAEEEWGRIGPVLVALVARGLTVSVDTTKALVAERACREGARLINDVSGGTMDPDLFAVAARQKVGLVISHIRGTPRTMQEAPHYQDLMGEIGSFLRSKAGEALAAGLPRESLVVDPGIGFGKTLEHNLEIVRRLRVLQSLGFPILVGLSRKSFIGRLTGLPPEERLEGSLGATAAAVAAGADLVRVHDVEATVRMLAVLDPIVRG